MPMRMGSKQGASARRSLSAVPCFLTVLLLAAACGDEDRTQTEFTASIDKTSTSADDTAAIPARAVPVPDTLEQAAPPQGTAAISLAPLGRAMVRGSGEVKAVGKASSVSVALTQGIAGATYEGAIRQGGCAAMGSSVASLLPATADSLGSGRAQSDVNVPIDSLTASPHVIVYGRGGRPETCAQIGPPSTTPPPPATLPPPQNVPHAGTMGTR
jgi:hypothetical protein